MTSQSASGGCHASAKRTDRSAPLKEGQVLNDSFHTFGKQELGA